MTVLACCLYETAVLFFFREKGISCKRKCAERFSNGDDNEIELYLSNRYPFPVRLEIIDEIPDILQRRDLLFKITMNNQEDKVLKYHIRPVRRGIYHFGHTQVFASTLTGFIARRFKTGETGSVKVYPSSFFLKQYELLASSNKLTRSGNKKIRQIGQQLEPDQIKNYVEGDDYRTINWKATARRNKLMVNIFQEERAQNVYCVIDKGRTMQSAFNGMTLLDYSINACLAISYVAMLKGDKVGLLTFEQKFDTFIPPSRHSIQMNQLQEALYHQQTAFAESNYLPLYQQINQKARNRGLLLVFTNFDSVAAMERQLRYLSLMSKRHTVLVIFFENIELESLIERQPASKEEIYETVIAEKLAYDKQLIIYKLRQYNILSLLTHPMDLTINVINRYLEMKARGNW
jgi:uncharacterized protein (DUF58 family)